MPSGATDRRLGRDSAGSAAAGEDLRRLNDDGFRGTAGGYGDGTGDLFAWGARQKQYRRSGSISVRTGSSGTGQYGIESARTAGGRRTRLGATLYSGSFGRSAPPSAREHNNVTRNRVLFLAVCLGLAVFIAHRIASGG